MGNVMDAARFFIDTFRSSEDLMTNLRLNKFLYFAQARSLVRLKQPLFDAPLQAWHYGPVVPLVHSQYKKDGKRPISDRASYSLEGFTPEQRETMIDVARVYGRYSTAAIVSMSRPSDDLRDLGRDEGTCDLSNEKVMECFQQKGPLGRFSISEKMPRLGRRDSDGYLCIPGE